MKCSLLPISCMIQYKDLCMLNRLLLGLYDFPVNDLFYLEYKNRCLRSSSKSKFVIKDSSKKSTRRNFIVRSAIYANTLHKTTPLNVFDDALLFRKELKSIFFKFLNDKFDDYHFTNLFSL